MFMIFYLKNSIYGILFKNIQDDKLYFYTVVLV